MRQTSVIRVLFLAIQQQDQILGTIGNVSVGLYKALLQRLSTFIIPKLRNTPPTLKTILHLFIFLVWLINGLCCKLLGLVPRHQQIVSRVLGDEHAIFFTKAIGVAEILMAVWVLSQFRQRVCTITQIILVAAMNSIEFILAPDLLLFGRLNSVVAVFFIAVLLMNEFIFKSHKSPANFSS